MPATRKITCTNLDLLLAIQQGETPHTLAARYSCTATAIRRRLRRLNLRRPATTPPSPSPGSAPPPDASLFPGPNALSALGDNIATLTAFKRACLEQLGATAGSPHLTTTDLERLQKVGALLLATLGQFHHHIALAVKLAERVHNVKYMAEFEEEMLDGIRSADPETATRIWAALQQRRAQRIALPADRDPH
jgi:hypothetical protein